MSAEARTAVKGGTNPDLGGAAGKSPGPLWWLVPLGIFGTTRFIDALSVVLLGRSQIDPSTLQVAPGRPPLETGDSYNALVANWDGQWYRYIVEHGYPTHLPTLHGVVQENQWAFYPLYPSVLRLVTWTGLPFGVAASFISVVFAGAAICLLYRFLIPRLGRFGASISVLALCVAPAALIWQVAYTESLALFLVVAALGFLSSRRYGLFLVAALALSLTRPIVLPLAVVPAVLWWARWRHRDSEPFDRGERIRLALVTVATAASFLVWPAVAAITTRQPDAYFVTQRAWLSKDVHGWPNWIFVLWHGSAPALLVLLPVALVTLVFLVLRRPAKAWGPELRIWSLVYPLYLLVSTTPTTSIFRYAMLSIVPWWPIPEVGERVRWARDRWALVILVSLIGVSIQVAWLRWFWVISPAAIERP